MKVMHWFWRATLAAFTAMCGYSFVQHIPWPIWGSRPELLLLYNLMSTYVSIVLGITVYGLLTRQYYGRRCRDVETRCRKCGYILRGISEPRCPECGERI